MEKEIEFNVCRKCNQVLANIGSSVITYKYDSDTEEVATTYLCGNCAPEVK